MDLPALAPPTIAQFVDWNLLQIEELERVVGIRFIYRGAVGTRPRRQRLAEPWR